jgi:chemotaxis protein MotB
MSKTPPNTIFIVKKARGHAGGHHGGAWKVAYADFVTAMMAFFLVMWLVTQSKDVKAGVAGYFRDPGIFNYEHGKGVLPGGTPGVEANGAPKITMVDPKADAEKDRQQLNVTADKIRAELQQAPEFKRLRDQVEVSVAPDGLRIEMVERSGSSFFGSGSAVLLGDSERILGVIAKELSGLSNEVVIEGHSDSRPFANGEKYGNWELSADRANAARRVVERQGLHPGQIRGVRGYADTELHIKSDPFDPRNRRVSIVVRSKTPDQVSESGAGSSSPSAASPEAAKATPVPAAKAQPGVPPAAAPAKPGPPQGH